MEGSIDFQTVNVGWCGHASLKLTDSDGKIVYIDPWSEVVRDESEPGDVIVSTHDHFDHFDKKAIQQLKKKNTVVLATEQSVDKVPEDLESKIIKPGSSVKARDLRFQGVEAYNIDKYRDEGEPFHPKGFCVGVLFEMDGLTFYHASDTDAIPEMEKLKGKVDVAFLPVGGKYTMDQEEALEAVKMIEPEYVVPIHYGYVDETVCDTYKFQHDVEEQTGSKPAVIGKK